MPGGETSKLALAELWLEIVTCIFFVINIQCLFLQKLSSCCQINVKKCEVCRKGKVWVVKRNGVHRHTTFEKKRERNGLNFGILEKKHKPWNQSIFVGRVRNYTFFFLWNWQIKQRIQTNIVFFAMDGDGVHVAQSGQINCKHHAGWLCVMYHVLWERAGGSRFVLKRNSVARIRGKDFGISIYWKANRKLFLLRFWKQDLLAAQTSARRMHKI